LGYAIGAPEWINEFNKVRGPFNVGVLQQIAAEVMLKHFDTLRHHARQMVEQRDRMFNALQKMPGVTPFPSAANFVLARFPDAAKVFDGLKARGILVRNLSALHPHMANTLRLSAGTPSEVEALLVALDGIL
jgi:histidinol-phosphate aminotransferase